MYSILPFAENSPKTSNTFGTNVKYYYLPSSWRKAKDLGYKRYFTGKSCKYGHICARNMSRVCVKCAIDKQNFRYMNNRDLINERQRRWRENNPVLAAEKSRLYRKANLQSFRDNSRRWRENNPDYSFELGRQWRENNREHLREIMRLWKKKNSHRVREYSSRRRAAKLSAMPDWLTEDELAEIEYIYETCPLDHHVDHIVPLQGKNVCGLHVPWNLQHLDKTENMRKNNHYDDNTVEEELELEHA